jgi:tetratricopeptide (TPR) repeat protein
MKGTIRITTLIVGIIGMLLLTCCKHEANYRSDLLRADSVMDARPDSAYGIVAKIRPDSLDEANRALLCLLSTQAKWKTDQNITKDTMWDEAIQHFTEQEDYDRLAKCYYYRGVVWKERNEVDKAMKDYLSAAEYIGKTRDYYYNNLINSYIGHLYMDQMAYDKTPKYFTAAYQAAKAMNDSVGMAYALMDICDYYDCSKQFKKSIANAQKAFKLIRCDTTNTFYTTIANKLANTYYYLGDYKKSLHYALQILPLYSKDSISDNGPYYATLARVYFSLKKYDEAKKYYMQAIKSPVMETEVVSYDGLHNIFEEKNERKLAAHYQAVADSIEQVVYDQNKSDVLVQAQSEHKSQELVKLVSNKNAKKIRGFLYILILFALIASWAFIKKRKARKKYEKEKNALLTLTEEEHEQNIGLKNAITGIKGVHSMLAAGELAEARVFLQLMLKHPKKIKDWEQHDWNLIKDLVSEIDAHIVIDLSTMDNLNEREKGICMLSIVGFPLQTIADIYSLEVRSLSQIKVRIKGKIIGQRNDNFSVDWIDLLGSKRGRKKTNNS